MKKISKIFACGLMAAATAACSLDYEPEEFYSDVTEGVQTGNDNTSGFATRADVESYMLTLTKKFSTSLEPWYLDQMLIQETHSDNCYSG